MKGMFQQYLTRPEIEELTEDYRVVAIPFYEGHVSTRGAIAFLDKDTLEAEVCRNPFL